MIDPHVHLRDWNQKHKETVKHGLEVAYKAGLDAVFEMPNTDPPLTSRENIIERIELADQANIPIFHGLYAGITKDPKQIEEVVKAYEELFPRVVGLKMFTSNSSTDLSVTNEKTQRTIYKKLAQLNYTGVLSVHCEKEQRLSSNTWNPSKPFTHTLARPPISEIESILHQIKFAQDANYKGILNICHISLPNSLETIEQASNFATFKITCEVTPHHCLLYDELMKNRKGILLKANPPLRSKSAQEDLLKALLNGRINHIATDHAPHTLEEKTEKHYSGIPGLPYYPHFIKKLKERKIPQRLLDTITHNNIVEIFNIKIKNTHRKPDYNLDKEYEFDPFRIFKS